MKRTFLAAAILLLVLSGAGTVAAHDGSAPLVLVQAEFILPGQSFEVVVADIGEDAPVDFAIVKDARTEALGTSRAAPNGHLMANLVLPADFPLGYAQLSATVRDVISTSTWVLVGERTSSTPPAPASTATAPWWSDPSVLVLGAFVVGAVGVVGYLLFKPRTVAPARVVAPRRSKGKCSRR